MQSKKSTVFLLIAFFVGLPVLLYPSISSYWNSRTQSEAIVDYETMLKNFKPEDYSAYFAEAEDYNRQLAALNSPLLEHQKLQGYYDILNLGGTGIMGYSTIDKINQELPVYHGTSEAVLSVAVGHLEGTSLPVGERVPMRWSLPIGDCPVRYCSPTWTGWRLGMSSPSPYWTGRLPMRWTRFVL